MPTIIEKTEIVFFRERYENTYGEKWVGSDNLLVLIIEAQKIGDYQDDEDKRARQEVDTLEAMRDYVP